MTEETVILAELANYKIIQSRNVFQILLEVDISKASEVTDTLGWPDLANSKYVEVKLLKDEQNTGV